MPKSSKSDEFPTPDLVIAETGKRIPEQQAYLQIVRTGEVLSGDVSALLAEFGLSGKQYNVLRALRRGGEDGLTAAQIGSQMTDPGADVTRLVDRLVREGLVERRHGEQDRRVVRSVLTKKGQALLAEIDAPLIEAHKTQLGHMSHEELATLAALVKKARLGSARGT
ncbi:MAG: MarR family transcriptional regulator [Rhodomicrobium sp.]|nr:MarR family transcriptional regulator [Rhodomicrobium sp.]